MFVPFQRIREARMLRISHRLGEVDCSIAALEQLHHTADPAQLAERLAEHLHQPDLADVTPEQANARKLMIMRLLACSAAVTLSMVTMDTGLPLSSLLLMTSFSFWVKALTELLNSSADAPMRSRTMPDAAAEAWLMQHAAEARMLHARRALYLLIQYDHLFRTTQGSRFCGMLHDCISLYLYLLRYAAEHPAQCEAVYAFISATLPALTRTLLSTGMHAALRPAMTRYDAACRRVMRSVCDQGIQFLRRLQREAYQGDMSAQAMKRQFSEMRSRFIRDGLIDEQHTEDFSPGSGSFTSAP